MERITGLAPRENWQKRCEEVGFNYHTFPDGQYWKEDVGYKLSAAEVDDLELSTNVLHAECLDYVEATVRSGDYDAHYGLSDLAKQLIQDSWQARHQAIYGRFDFAYGVDGKLKLLEYNADTPTSLLESSVVQWDWLVDRKLPDQFNSIHEKLIARWKELPVTLWAPIHFAALEAAGPEDWGNLYYLLDTAVQAGHNASALHMEGLGFNAARGRFVDAKDAPVTALFKLYPWEQMVTDQFAAHIKPSGLRIFEPAWKMLLSSKALLPLLHRRCPRHENLLPAFFADECEATDTAMMRKPIYGREGSTMAKVTGGHVEPLTEGNATYAASGYVLQEWLCVRPFDGWRPVIGSWVIGDKAAGIGIREDQAPVTGNDSQFVPHWFEPA
jgi:glutathionylspermidine synthase